MELQRSIGIGPVPPSPWGTHFCLFYRTKQDLLDILVPYFKTGLENGEFCMWVTSEPLGAEEARAALAQAVPDLSDYEQCRQIEILNYDRWYKLDGHFDSDRVLAGWVEKEAGALQRGFAGLRLTGNTFWLEEQDWRAFIDYEAAVDDVISKYHMIALCTYSLDKCGASEVVDVTNHHQFALCKRGAKWEMIESADRRRAEQAHRYAAELEASVAERTRDLKILNANLERSEARYRALFERMNEGFALHEIICDATGKPIDYRFLDLNPAFEQLTGLKRENVIGKTAREVLPGLEDFWVETYGRVAIEGEPARFENYAAPLKQHYEVLAYCPEPRQFAVLFLNITERRETEKSVRVAMQRIEKLNRELEQQTAELQASNVQLEETAEELQVANVNMEEALSLEQEARVEAEAGRRMLEQMQLQVQELNRALERRAGDLERANKELEAFSYSVSHDLRTPLTGIESFAHMLREDYAGALDPIADRYLDLITENTGQMKQLIEGLLRLSRLGRQALHRVEVEPAELAHGAIQELEPQLKDRRVEITFGELPACVADPILLRQVYANLLSNAVKFTRVREVAKIEVGSFQWKRDGESNGPAGLLNQDPNLRSPVYYIRDNGVGFDPRDSDRLFGVFQRLHGEQEYEGTGIGLALVQRIVHRHGGRVWAEGEPGKGAAFYFTLGDDCV